MTIQPASKSIPTFKEHCVVNEAWLASACTSSLPFVWHSKIQAVLDLIEANAGDLDQHVSLLKKAGGANLVADESHHKRKFFDAQASVNSVLLHVAAGYPRLRQALAPASDVLRARALHTFAGAAALTLIQALQRFEGVLITRQGGLVVRLFADLPSFRGQPNPMIVLPYRHEVNGLAYGHEVDNGVVRARICEVDESTYKIVVLPRRDAEHWQDRHTGPEHLYFGWVLPQWAVAGWGDFPRATAWWISVLSNARSKERQIGMANEAWDRALDPLPFIDDDHPAKAGGLFGEEELTPRLTVLVLPSGASKQARETPGGISASTAAIADSRAVTPPPAENLTTVLCIAAAQVEFIAACRRFEKEFGAPRRVPLEKGTDHAVEFTDATSRTRWLLTVQSFQAEIDAALKAQRLVLTLKPEVTLMIGMCMGMPLRKAIVGTVVVPNEVRGFDHQRATAAGLEYRAHGDLSDNPLYGFARIFDASSLGYDVVLDKGLASASVKMEDVKSPLLEHIQTNFADAAAYDMEGWGFYRGVKAARVDGSARCLWIKGIADNGEPQGKTDEARAAKKKEQARATENALDFAVRLIRGYAALESFDRT